uniref:Pancreatic trypsin inhibitor n=1 Tax=Rhipicephalus zambeziensis TaxID=60191 RepID=A0A224YCR7_9ACAR
MRYLSSIALVVFVGSSLILVESQNYTEKECKNKTKTPCTYPDMCYLCPKPEEIGHIRLEVFYFNNDTKTCESMIGNGESCNTFTSFQECEFLCDPEYDPDAEDEDDR